MNLKTYQAYTMAEALAAVKRDLGPNAVILNTRSYARGGILGVGRRTIIEVTATASGGASRGDGRIDSPPEQPIPAVTGKSPMPARSVALRSYAERAAQSPDGEGPTEQDKLKTRRLAQAMLEQHRRRQELSGAAVTQSLPVAAQSDPAVVLAPAGLAPAAAAPRPAPSPGPSRPVARRFILKPTGGEPIATEAAPPASGIEPETVEPEAVEPDAVEPRGSGPKASEPAAETNKMRDELCAIRQMVGEVLQRQVNKSGAPAPSMPQGLFDMYLRMVGQDLSEELADRVINEVRDGLTGDDLEDEVAVRAALCRSLSDYIPAADEEPPLESPDGRPLTLALVGPTGVGKTTTLAKLAASFKLRHRRKVGLVTADTYRIAAVDQLRTYANIIGLPVRVVLTPGEMRQAVHSLSDCDVILIDTAGRSQNDSSRLEELKSFLDAADPHEVHLVLSSTAGEKVLLHEAEAFGAVGIDKVVLTKLDEAVSFGVLVNVIRRIGKKLSFFTTGQEVPDHLEIGHPERLADLVLGGVLGGDLGGVLGGDLGGDPAREDEWARREAVSA